MDTIYINENYKSSFILEHGKEIKKVIIPAGVMSHEIRIPLSSFPNIEEFFIGGNSNFEFSNGILYYTYQDNISKQSYREIKYVSKSVRNLHIEHDVRDINNWHGIEKITVDENNTAFTVFDKMLMDKSMEKVYIVFSDDEEMIIPKGVKNIDYFAFANCEKLKRIVFPATYTWKELPWTINEKVKAPEIVIEGERISYADGIIFDNLLGRALIYLGDTQCCRIPINITTSYSIGDVFNNVESFEIDDHHPTFSSVDGIILDKTQTKLIFYPRKRTEFIIPETVTEICNAAVSDCYNLEHIIIPENVKKTGWFAFSRCYRLKSVVIPKELKEIGDSAFSCCENLRNVEFLDPDPGDFSRAFDKCESDPIEGVYYVAHMACGFDFDYKGELRIRNGTTVLIDMCFNTYSEAKMKSDSLFLPASMKKIGLLDIPLKQINVDENNKLFRSVDGILFSNNMKQLIRYPEERHGKTFAVPEGVESIEEFAFYNCKHLRKVILPDSIKTIGEYAFSETIKGSLSIELPSTPITIDEVALTPAIYYKYGGKSLEQDLILKIRYKNTFIPVQLLGNWKENKDEFNLAEFFETGDFGTKKSLFFDVKTPEYKRFMALYLVLFNGDVECGKYLLRIKNKLTEDPMYADLLEFIDFKQIKESANKLSANNTSKKVSLSKWSIKNLPDGTYEIEKYKGKETIVEIPDEYNGVRITSIGESAFSGERFKSCTEIKKVIVPDSIKIIKENAFEYCWDLQEINLPDSLTAIGEEAFFDCNSLKEIRLPQQLTTISYGCFHGCSNMRNINMGKSVITIEEVAFFACTALEEIELSESLQYIESFSFCMCEKLKNIYLPHGLSELGMSPFSDCYSLKEINVSEKNEKYSSIEGVLFDKLGKRIICYPGGRGPVYAIPDGVEVIGENAFEGCKSLTSITLPDSVRRIENQAFRGCSSLKEIEIPESVEHIGDVFIELNSDFVVYAPLGSYAYEHCLQLRGVLVIDSSK